MLKAERFDRKYADEERVDDGGRMDVKGKGGRRVGVRTDSSRVCDILASSYQSSVSMVRRETTYMHETT